MKAPKVRLCLGGGEAGHIQGGMWVGATTVEHKKLWISFLDFHLRPCLKARTQKPSWIVYALVSGKFAKIMRPLQRLVISRVVERNF